MQRLLFMPLMLLIGLSAVASAKPPPTPEQLAESQAREERRRRVPALTEAQCSSRGVDTRAMGPVRNQDDTQWCFAFAAADLLSYEARETVSAIAVGMAHFDAELRKAPNATMKQKIEIIDGGGNVIDTLANLQSSQLCSEASISSEPLVRFLKLQQEVRARGSRRASDVTGLRGVILSALGRAEPLPAQACSEVGANIASLFSAEESVVVQTLNSPHRSGETPWRTLLRQFCRPVGRAPNTRGLVYLSRGGSERPMAQVLNDAINNGKPVSIIYDVSSLYTKRNGPEAESHVSVVVARRWNGQECEFQVRNSWGRSCDAIKNCDPSTGIFWITASQANTVITHAEHFRR